MFSSNSRDPHVAPVPSEAARAAISADLLAEAQALAPSLAAWRHDLHGMPELGCATAATSAYVQERLGELGVAFTTFADGCGVLAQLGSGDEGAPCVLLRADMDGLPFAEKSGEPWASTNGCAHACGHDMHATALLGAASLLKAHEAAILASGGTVKLLFQPGEETLDGANAAIAAGVLEAPRVDTAFAMHVNGRCPMGLMLYGTHALAGAYTFRIRLVGRGGHGSVPEKCIDPIAAGVRVHLALQELTANEVPAGKEAVLSVGKFSGGSVPNAIPDECVLEGTLRAFEPELLERLRARVREVVVDVASARGVRAEVETLSDVPPTVLDAGAIEKCASYAGFALPEMRFRNIQHALGCEDFAFVSERVPSAYFTVGSAASDAAEHFTMHDPRVRFDDAELPFGAAAYAAVALGWLADSTSR